MIYPKTENLYASNGAQDSTRARGPEFGFRAPGAEQIARWLVTEKVDGMNMRVVFEPDADEPVRILGRSDNAQIPKDLLAHMQEILTGEALFKTFGGYIGEPGGVQTLVDWPDMVVLFGEGFGPGIQKAGQAYGGVKRFALFDVVVDGHWLRWSDVEDVAAKLGVTTVPVLARDVDLAQALTLVHQSELQAPDSEHIEGIVCRTDPYLFDGRGNRVMFKYKARDL